MVLPAAARARELAARVRNAVVAPAFSRAAAGVDELPVGGVAVWFATGPANRYQFDQWRRPLEELARQIGVFVVVDRPDTGAAVRERTTLPVTFARSSSGLERLIGSRDVRVVLYLNQVEPNFRMLRFTAPVHVQIGHGESDKDGSLSHQHQAYDLTFVAGEAGRDRLRTLLLFDVDRRTRLIGRPQLDHRAPGAPSWTVGDGRRILYAPTWEGDRPSIAYGSSVSHGVRLVEGLLADPDVRVVYRPHPRTGTASRDHLRADRQIRGLLAGPRHLVDTGEYGWQLDFADACVTDVSAVAYDWLATGKPLVVTEPGPTARRPASSLLEQLTLLPPSAAGEALRWLAEAPDLSGLQQHYFGELAGRASTQRFEAAVLELAGRGSGGGQDARN